MLVVLQGLSVKVRLLSGFALNLQDKIFTKNIHTFSKILQKSQKVGIRKTLLWRKRVQERAWNYLNYKCIDKSIFLHTLRHVCRTNGTK